MNSSICGLDCTMCQLHNSCKGCADTQGQPFGAPCVTAVCLKDGENALCAFKERLMAAFNELDIPDMEPVTTLNGLKGSYINIAYTLPNKAVVKFWEDDKIYLGNQLSKKDSDRCYGIVAGEHYLMVAEYSGYGAEAEVVVFKRWR